MIDQTIKDFSGGMWTNPDGTAIPDNALLELINMRLTEKGYPTIRPGSLLYNSTSMSASYPCRGLFINESASSDSAMYIYAMCGGYVYYSTGNGTFTNLQISSTDIQFTETALWTGLIWNGVLYVANGQYPCITAPTTATSTALKIDATTVTALTYTDTASFPKNVNYMVGWGGRFFTMQDGTSTVIYSQVNDPEAYNDGTNPYYEYFGNEDGEYGTGLFVHDNGVGIVKPSNIYMYYCRASSPLNWEVKKIEGQNPNFGCYWNESIAPYTWRGREGWAWLGPEGVIHFDGRDCNEISYPIRDKVAAFPQTKPSRSIWQIDDQTEWEGGTDGSNLLYTKGGLIEPLPQETLEDWTAGTSSSVETAKTRPDEETGVQNDYVRMSHIDDDFNDGLTSRWTFATGVGVFSLSMAGEAIKDRNSMRIYLDYAGTPYSNAYSGGYIACSQNTGYWGYRTKGFSSAMAITNNSNQGYGIIQTGSVVKIYRIATNYIYTRNISLSGLTPSTFVASGTYSGTFTEDHTVMVKIAAGGAISVYVNGTLSLTATDTTYSSFGRMWLMAPMDVKTIEFKDVWHHATATGGTGDLITGTFTSQTIDYGVDVSAHTYFSYGNLVANIDTVDRGAITFKTQSSDNGTDWEAATNVGTAGENGGTINSTVKRYLRWIAYLTTASYGSDNPKLKKVFVGGQYISTALNIGSVPTDVGQWQVTQDLPDGTTVEHFIETSTSSGGLDGDGWVQVEPNTQLNYATFFGSSQTYLRFKILFTMEIGIDGTGWENVPSVDRVRFEYYKGSRQASPCGFVWDGKYHLAVDENSDGINDAVWVCDERGAWGKDTNLQIGQVAKIRGRIMYAGSDEGKVRWLYEGGNDEGKQVSYKLVTREQPFIGDAAEYKDMDKCFRFVRPLYKSNIPILIDSQIPSEGWRQVVGDSSLYSKARLIELDGRNTAQNIHYKIRPSIEDFSENPNWSAMNTSTNIYWHEDQYIYFKATQDTTNVRRFYKLLPEMLDETEEMGFWVKVYPTTLQADSITWMGFFNTNSVDNSTNFFGFQYREHAAQYCGILLFGNAGTSESVTAWTGQQLTVDTSYYVAFTYNPSTKIAKMTVYDSTKRIMTIPPKSVSIGTRTFDVNAFGLLSYPVTSTEYAEWRLQECLPFYRPSEYGGLNRPLEFSLEQITHQFVPLNRMAR